MNIIYKFYIINNHKPYRTMYAYMSDDKYYKTFNHMDKIESVEISQEEYASQLLNFIVTNKIIS